MRFNSFLRWVLPVFFSLAMLAALFYFFYEEQYLLSFQQNLAQLHYPLLALGIGAFLLAILVKSYRLIYLMEVESSHLKKVFFILIGAFPMGFFLAGAGITMRIFLFKETLSYPVIKGVLNTLLERLSDLLVLVLLFSVALFFLFDDKNFALLSLEKRLYFLGSCFLLLSLLYFRRAVLQFCLARLPQSLKRPTGKRYRRWAYALKKKLVFFDQAFRLLHSPRKAACFFGLTALNWLLEIFFIYACLNAMQLSISYMQTVFIFMLLVLFLLLPLSISGLGVLEFAFVKGGELLGLETSLLLPAFLIHFLLLLLNGGLVAVSVNRLFYSIPGFRKLFARFLREGELSS